MNPLPGREHGGEFAESHAQDELRDRKPGWAVHGISQRRTKIPHRDGFGSNSIDRTCDAGVGDQEHNESSKVIAMNPGNELRAG